MRRQLVGAAKRIASGTGALLHGLTGRRAGDGFGILMYHRVARGAPGIPAPTWNVTPSRLRRQIEGLLDAGFSVWPLRRLVAHAESGRAVPERVTAITFDDGYENVFLEALPVLDDLSVPATVFVATAYLGSAAPFPFDHWGCAWHGEAPAACWRPLRWGQCRAMAASGLIEIGAHSHAHCDFRGDAAALRGDLERSIRELHDKLGTSEPLFAFPYGAPDLGFAAPEQLRAAREAGAACALTTDGALVRRGQSPFGWGRFEVTAWDTAATLEAKLSGFYDWMRSAKRWFLRLSPPPYLPAPKGSPDGAGSGAQWSDAR